MHAPWALSQGFEVIFKPHMCECEPFINIRVQFVLLNQ